MKSVFKKYKNLKDKATIGQSFIYLTKSIFEILSLDPISEELIEEYLDRLRPIYSYKESREKLDFKNLKNIEQIFIKLKPSSKNRNLFLKKDFMCIRVIIGIDEAGNFFGEDVKILDFDECFKKPLVGYQINDHLELEIWIAIVCAQYNNW